MENAHLRMGLLEYERYTEKIAARIRVRVSHYIGEDQDSHLLSVFGNDSDVGAITAAIYEKARFRLTFPDGEKCRRFHWERERSAIGGASAFRGENRQFDTWSRSQKNCAG